MSLGLSLNKFKNGMVLESETAQGLLALIQSISCPVEVVQIYFDSKEEKHIAIIITEKKVIRKIKAS